MPVPGKLFHTITPARGPVRFPNACRRLRRVPPLNPALKTPPSPGPAGFYLIDSSIHTQILPIGHRIASKHRGRLSGTGEISHTTDPQHASAASWFSGYRASPTGSGGILSRAAARGSPATRAGKSVISGETSPAKEAPAPKGFFPLRPPVPGATGSASEAIRKCRKRPSGQSYTRNRIPTKPQKPLPR